MSGGRQNSIETIQNEYRRIDIKWLRMQYQLMLWLVVVTVAVEVVMFFVLQGLGGLTAPMPQYLGKYLLAPFVCNLLLCMAAAMALRSRKLSEKQKVYTVTVLMTAMAFAVYTVHSFFYVLFLIFIIPMIVSVVYGDQRLTAIVAGLCVGGKVVSDLFLFWDPTRKSVLDSVDAIAEFVLSVLLLVLIYGICHVMIKIEREKNNVSIDLERQRQRYQEQSVTDSLTKIRNRQALRQAFQSLDSRWSGMRVALAMMDLDDFKSLNDTYGHNRGDQYLKAMGRVLRGITTDRVIPFRYGGDEFCVLFCEHDREETEEICRRIQSRFAAESVNRNYRAVTISIGVAEYVPGEMPFCLLERADAALYQAKQEKGSICLAAEKP